MTFSGLGSLIMPLLIELKLKNLTADFLPILHYYYVSYLSAKGMSSKFNPQYPD